MTTNEMVCPVNTAVLDTKEQLSNAITDYRSIARDCFNSTKNAVALAKKGFQSAKTEEARRYWYAKYETGVAELNNQRKEQAVVIGGAALLLFMVYIACK